MANYKKGKHKYDINHMKTHTHTQPNVVSNKNLDL